MVSYKLIVILFLSVAFDIALAEDHDFKNASEETLYRNFTLAVCTGTAYEKDSKKIATDAGKAATGYSEFSHIDLAAFDESRKLAIKWLAKDYKSKHGGQIEIMKCIDLYNSQELKTLFAKYDPCKNRDAWLDENEFMKKCK